LNRLRIYWHAIEEAVRKLELEGCAILPGINVSDSLRGELGLELEEVSEGQAS